MAAFARSGDYDALQRVFEQLRALRLEPASHLEVRASEGYISIWYMLICIVDLAWGLEWG